MSQVRLINVVIRHSSFGLLSSFVIGHSSFAEAGRPRSREGQGCHSSENAVLRIGACASTGLPAASVSPLLDIA